MNTGQLAVLLIFGTGLVAVTGKAIVRVLRVLREGPTPEDRKAMREEADAMVAMAHELERMQQRIEALETILLDRDRREEGR
jgi:hypothetical protein